MEQFSAFNVFSGEDGGSGGKLFKPEVEQNGTIAPQLIFWKPFKVSQVFI